MTSRRIRLAVALVLAMSATARADLPTPETKVGDVVTHPVTGHTATVVEVLTNSVLTDNDDVIMVYWKVGDTFTDPNDTNDPPATVTITEVEINATTGLAERFKLDTGEFIAVARSVDTTPPPESIGAPGEPGGPVDVPIPSENRGVVADKRRGSTGAGGKNGYGIEICDPTGIFGGCYVIGYRGTAGAAGGVGPAVTVDIKADHGGIESVSLDLPGITATSIGGTGGKGGNAFGFLPGLAGGDAGEGGTVRVTNETDITTRRLFSHGIVAQSRSGAGGAGGTGYIASGGGAGGAAASGGTVTVTNGGDITTFGLFAYGIFAQSMGGSAGAGGDSWGFVGTGGSSPAGGDGGTVTVTNDGTLITVGDFSHGLVAQSVGGDGGDGGDAGGVVAFGGRGSAGGQGGAASAALGATGSIRTLGVESHGMLVQSIGGGGGFGGGSGGVVAFGGTGSASGNGGTVTVTTEHGALVVTERDGSYAILAQSIGKGGGDGSAAGGGDGGAAGGVVAIGGAGGGGGSGGLVDVDNGADLRTTGEGAFALFAQSVGGGGGTARGTGGVVSIGGDGGIGGTGGTVDVENRGIIQTDGDFSDAVVAQSVGGGGGAGGGAGGVVALGGAGESSGAGGEVDLVNHGQVTTLGHGSRGLFAQSIGGGGGFGATAGGPVAIGGSSGKASDGGIVDLTNTGVVVTWGDLAHALQAQSVGGGGGDGGVPADDRVPADGSTPSDGGSSGGVFFTLGGSGSGGGKGAAATITNSNDLTTWGDDARGISVQSIGGGGGNGGGSYSGSAFIGGAFGGRGGGGGDGGLAKLFSEARVPGIEDLVDPVAPLIQTDGDRATGIFVQSIGGGGGAAGLSVQASGGAFVSISGAVGGDGGGGGKGGGAEVNGDATVVTRGEDADGVVVQSVGGGGGKAGGAVTVSVGVFSGGAVALGIGGSGGDGGDGGEVKVGTGGDIHTTGDLSEGFLAHSTGGGGGSGGWVVSTSGSGSAIFSAAGGIGLGGSGGKGGAGGLVDVTYVGNVTTEGAQADAWTVQSVGGGGGHGGFSVATGIAGSGGGALGVSFGIGGRGGGGGAGGHATGTLFGQVTTHGNESSGMLVQSDGGGGGRGGFNVSSSVSIASTGTGSVSIGVGGSGGDGGDGGEVDLTFEGAATTHGADSAAIIAESSGGGGGQGAFNVSGGISGSGGGSGAVMFGVGGAGGGGGIGGLVTSSVTGSVTTHGDRSAGVISQSVGGGGGNGGFNVSGGAAIAGTGSGNLSIGVGGAGGDGGSGGKVTASVTADVTTHGASAPGILVQSVGDGGGRGAFNVSGGLAGSSSGSGSVAFGVGGSGGAGGDSCTAVATVIGNVATTGVSSVGVKVQSAGGGGGDGAFNVSGGVSISAATGGLSIGVGGKGGSGGDAKLAKLDMTGGVTTEGIGAAGILVQSTGGGGGDGAFNVSGNVALASGAAVPISFGVGGFGGGGGDGGKANLIVKDGGVQTSGADTDAVTVQSIGGGGGRGAWNVSGSLGVSTGSTAVGTSIGVGGFGGDGGDGGKVVANIEGDVLATGVGPISLRPLVENVTDDLCSTFPSLCERLVRVAELGSNGILAQSVGGSGGSGGLNVSGGINGSPSSSGAINIGVGGFGGGGGNASTVNLTVVGNVAAVGDARTAVAAQSVGGSGGRGGANISGGLTGNGQFTLGVGGFGGGGGTADAVTVGITGDIEASGVGSRGLLAQSVGGGGGDGGFNVSGGINAYTGSKAPSAVLGLGGFGGAGNISAMVDATHRGSVVVEGSDSIAVLVQSVAGGGGAGAWNVAATGAAGTGFSASAGIGGKGGKGADAGNVTLHSDGYILADGRSQVPGPEAGPDPTELAFSIADTNFEERANGILVQSIGGGGGHGGMNVSGVIMPFGSQLSAGVGGTGGGGGHAGTVTVFRGENEAALLETLGHQSNGLTAQSVGGGGGNAGMNLVGSLSGFGEDQKFESNIVIGGGGGDAGNGKKVDVSHTGNIKTHGDQSIGLLAQSVGGGGGNAAMSVGVGLNRKAAGFNLAVGGGPGEGGDGDEVVVTHAGDIVTEGADSMAVFAQSVGGGGGNAAMTMSIALLASNKLNIGIGRYGGTGGLGGKVDVDVEGTITTQGDRSIGVLAQSVGNGGGRSGSSSIGGKFSSQQGESESTVNAALSVGLEGGSGGVAGEVWVDSSSDITTHGQDAHAIFAQSVGGGGGLGGSATNLVFRESMSAVVGIGGAGGVGGNGQLVDVLSTGVLHTRGAGSHGISAQSIGGGGGTGGMSGLVSVQIGGAAGGGNNNVGVSVGGTGGTGGNAGDVSVTNRGAITTQGAKSRGIAATSEGGGGGEGGIVINGSLGANRQSALTVGVGGLGGTGGDGGIVVVTNHAAIATTSADAEGIVARSVGGGGGDAGLVANLDYVQSESNASSTSISVNVGRRGGTGGDGGVVDVANAASGQIITTGAKAHGINAQSIGGGGGNGGSVVSINQAAGSRQATSLGLSVGGQGGEGGVGGRVYVTNAGLIDTAGETAHGIVARSAGGGGGTGGLALTLNAVIQGGTLASGVNRAVALSVGGFGGDGGDGGSVTVQNDGQIVTRGAKSHGIEAQSVGGGGGDANVGFGLANNLVTTVLANVIDGIIGGIGIKSGGGGEGGTVLVTHSGDITVLGTGSQAIKAESINGGGGGLVLDFNGITSLPGGEGLPGIGSPELGITVDPLLRLRAGGEQQANTTSGAVTINTTGTFGVAGDFGTGVGIQSIGGGGGTLRLGLGFADEQDGGRLGVVVDLGGMDASDSHGNDIKSAHSGDVITNGHHAVAASLQSIGGGGGRGLLSVEHRPDALGDVRLALGATDSVGNDGGQISHAHAGNIVTTADGATGFVLQSIGGGGGELHLGGAGATGVELGGRASSGDGGAVDFNLTGSLATFGDRAHGIVMQSIGGGGGAVFMDALDAAAVELSGDNSGNGGAMSLRVEGDVVTSGREAYGVFVQSLGGGGGFVEGLGALMAGGNGAGDRLDVALVGSVFSEAATAVYLQSAGSAGGGDINLELAAGESIIGGHEVASLVFEGGAANRMINRGLLASLAEVDGFAMRATDGDDSIENLGRIAGSIDLGGGVNALLNRTSGYVLAGSSIDLGDPSGSFDNAGMLDPGGRGKVTATSLNGSYAQHRDATAFMDLDVAADRLDSLHATGRATLAGAVEIELLNPHLIRSGAQSKTLFRADGGLVDEGLALRTTPSVVVDYGLASSAGQELALAYDVDFAAHGRLGRSASKVGSYINRVQDAGSSPALADLVTTLVATDEIDEYAGLMTQLSPDIYAAQQSDAIRAAQQFGRSLMSCTSPDISYRYEHQGSCMWLRVDFPSTTFDARDGVPRMDYEGTRAALGAQVTRGDWTFGGGLSTEELDSTGSSRRWAGSGDTLQVGGVAKYQLGRALLSSAIVAGQSEQSTRRLIDITEESVAKSNRDLDFAGLLISGSYRAEFGAFTLTPLVEFGALRMRSSGGRESGSDGLELDVHNLSDDHLWVRPGVEAAWERIFASGFSLRTYLQASLVSYLDGGETEVRAGLVGAPSGVDPMRIDIDLGDNQGLYGAGIDFVTPGNYGFQLRYERSSSDVFTTEQAMLKFAIPF